MTVHFFTKGNANCASSRQRAFLISERLKNSGVASVVHVPSVVEISTTRWPHKFTLLLTTLGTMLKIKNGDVIYLQRTIYNKYFFIFIVLHKIIFRRKMIFDIDDAIYLHSLSKTKILARLADMVIVGSHYLANWAEKYNKNVFIVPTSIDFSLYSNYTKRYSEVFDPTVIGWIGAAPAHYDNLKLLVPVFENLLADGVKFKFCLVGALRDKKVYKLFNGIKGLGVEFIDELKWSEPGIIPQTIQRFDVGLMPLIDSEWSRGKCSFKAVEYMACGVPAVVSAVGENNYLIQDGVDSFLASSTVEWVEKITRLCNDLALRVKLGQRAQQTIKDGYSFEANVPKLIGIINKL